MYVLDKEGKKEDFLLAEHVGDEVHLLLCGSDFLSRRGLGTTETEHRHDCGIVCVGFVMGEDCRFEERVA